MTKLTDSRPGVKHSHGAPIDLVVRASIPPTVPGTRPPSAMRRPRARGREGLPTPTGPTMATCIGTRRPGPPGRYGGRTWPRGQAAKTPVSASDGSAAGQDGVLAEGRRAQGDVAEVAAARPGRRLRHPRSVQSPRFT